MATVTISWDTTSQSFPAGTVAGNFHVEIAGGTLTAPLTMDVAASPAVFPDVPLDDPPAPDYTATVTRLDAGGNPLGGPAVVSFSVHSPPAVLVDIPNVVTADVVV